MTTSQRSLAKGSAAPGPVPEGLIRLYSMRFCPFAQRSRLVLAAKGINHEVVNINLKNKPDWFFEKSPSGMVPSIETSDGKIIYESPIVCDYLDEAFPGVKLTPADPYEKAQQKILLEQFSAVTSALYKIFFARKDNQDTTELKAQFFEKYEKLEETLAKRKSPYFGGESVSMIDYMIWPWFERFCIFDVEEVLEKTPNINNWYKLMLQDPAVQKTFTEPDVLLNFFKLYSKDSLDAVDYGLD
ncbi:glutathione S-transferase omega-1-like [Bufo gargarizans]|uniref:glutathione S-transferase omega-1-like n=1 Tax=Bufo gargarizans TaxID=30331 RepID=UPI001CF297D3|nr:glutathione S-transferase omega-1-like [Bufo gargarizans]XP_044154067.1 glutathione S-transferase omega-1-like [Bufo gargarizans]XP_044154068.1 glutathione S-transferase omega-1-like [Bufo gargarizans]XP_044154069.1 glutathione S-transferase omega-1-like [Bufo gargarizans]XP_044154070.1 glutathione S-transferase omega-1-like [Bufo gargarizans]XP_044154071.1 glutathione S-transferase omega-1-like [Bufo gargarizans]XP_044154072.1 glutathione S-transferase omega-1-like [Bufo gargarizans]